MAKRITVVVSQGQSHNPAKRRLEEEIVTALLLEPGIDVTVIPHLYDLTPDSTGVLALQGASGDMVLASWMFPRAARWILDRHDVRGQEGVTLLTGEDGADDEDEDDAAEAEAEAKARVIDQREIPKRKIYCLDLRASDKSQAFVDEILRIRSEVSTQVVSLGQWPAASDSKPAPAPAAVTRIDEAPERRWYPVIDFSRCTNCMECIDFCLFGVYGVDKFETILVEQPDNCRKGCPACSRVCPENAIIFPQHKTPAIAGALEAAGSLKIDLSKLFGAPETNESAVEIAARERDEQLMLAGRQAVGMSVGIPKRQASKPSAPKDDLDSLLDALDDANL
jgi:NAD-dependent dihydropyrimidine dehydrogenase PreA subunit